MMHHTRRHESTYVMDNRSSFVRRICHGNHRCVLVPGSFLSGKSLQMVISVVKATLWANSNKLTLLYRDHFCCIDLIPQLLIHRFAYWARCWAVHLYSWFTCFFFGGVKIIRDVITGAKVHFIWSLSTESRMRKTCVMLLHIKRDQLLDRSDCIKRV